MIKIYHLIYYREKNDERKQEHIILRYFWDFKKNDIKENIPPFTVYIPNFHRETISFYYDTWFLDDPSRNIIEFTFGVEDDISAIAIKNPFDPKIKSYKKQIGNDIVTGRINRMKGIFKKNIYERDEDNNIIKDNNGNYIIKKKIYYKPYDLDEFYLVYKGY